ERARPGPDRLPGRPPRCGGDRVEHLRPPAIGAVGMGQSGDMGLHHRRASRDRDLREGRDALGNSPHRCQDLSHPRLRRGERGPVHRHVGFALIGAPGFSLAASVTALVTFWLGALAGGRIGVRLGQHRGHLLTVTSSLQAALLAVSVVLAAVSGSPVAAGYRYPLIVAMSVAMGLQNATARKLAVPDLTTTVLTLTITGIAADSSIAGQ